MKPTPELRWVERRYDMGGQTYTYIRVLQQKWCRFVYNDYGVANATDVFEWRDVPTVKEGV